MKLFEDLPSTNKPINAENLNQIQDNLVVVSATEPTGDNREKVWIQQGKNLYNKNDVVNGYSVVVSTGKLTPYEGRTSSGYISIEPNTNYIISKNGVELTVNYAIYNENKEYITGTQGSQILTPSNAKYIRFYSTTANMQMAQLEQGTTITTPKIYAKNDYDVYEEFISKSEYVAVNYSDYIEYNENVTKVNSTTIYRKDNVVFLNFDLSGNFLEGETTIGTLKKKLKFGTFGAGRVGNSDIGATSVKPATIIMLSNGAIRIHAVGAGPQVAGTVTLLLDE